MKDPTIAQAVKQLAEDVKSRLEALDREKELLEEKLIRLDREPLALASKQIISAISRDESTRLPTAIAKMVVAMNYVDGEAIEIIPDKYGTFCSVFPKGQS